MLTKPPSLERSLDLWLEGHYRDSNIEFDRWLAQKIEKAIERWQHLNVKSTD